jgi:hypothetical protein
MLLIVIGLTTINIEPINKPSIKGRFSLLFPVLNRITKSFIDGISQLKPLCSIVLYCPLVSVPRFNFRSLQVIFSLHQYIYVYIFFFLIFLFLSNIYHCAQFQVNWTMGSRLNERFMVCGTTKIDTYEIN